jgi:phosphatidylglycerophosphate synthase
MTQVQSPSVPAPSALIVGDAAVRLWGLTSHERLRRQFKRLGIEEPAAGADVLVMHAGWVYDEPLVQALRDAPGGTLLVDEASGQAVAAKVRHEQAEAVAAALLADTTDALPWAQIRTPATLASHYNNKLRKRETPYLLPLTAATLSAIEKRMFSGSYKGVTDLVTKYVWPTPARYATKACAIVGITPNQVTTVSLLAVIAAFYAFWHGQFALGLLSAWFMTFLDTVDGKLARVTLRSSPFGDIFDHGIDLIHPPFWYWAWFVGLGVTGQPLENTALVMSIVVGGYVAQRIEEGLFMKLFGIDMHIWRPFDSFFRLITARRNPNLLILTASVVLGRPDLGMMAVAIWTLLSFGVHTQQIVQALLAQRSGPITSWLSR